MGVFEVLFLIERGLPILASDSVEGESMTPVTWGGKSMRTARVVAVVVIALVCCGFFTNVAAAQPIIAPNSCRLPAAGPVPNAYCSFGPTGTGSGSGVVIGPNSCNVPTSCLDLGVVSIGSNSCNGSDAC